MYTYQSCYFLCVYMAVADPVSVNKNVRTEFVHEEQTRICTSLTRVKNNQSY